MPIQFMLYALCYDTGTVTGTAADASTCVVVGLKVRMLTSPVIRNRKPLWWRVYSLMQQAHAYMYVHVRVHVPLLAPEANSVVLVASARPE